MSDRHSFRSGQAYLGGRDVMRNRWICRRLALLVVGIGALWLWPVPVPVAQWQDAKPVKKDSRIQVRPKQAVLTTSVSPSEARPGETVTYSVTAKLEAPWHIYKYSKDQIDEGPKFTQFDFFDTAGLTPQGDWTASRDPMTQEGTGLPGSPLPRIPRGRGHLEPQAQGSREGDARQEDAPMPGRLHDLHRRELQHPRPVDLARRRADDPARLVVEDVSTRHSASLLVSECRSRPLRRPTAPSRRTKDSRIQPEAGLVLDRDHPREGHAGRDRHPEGDR